MEKRNQNEIIPAASGDDGQRSVHGRRSTGRDGCQWSEKPHQERCPEQCDNLTNDIGQQGDSAQFRTTILGDEDA